MMTIIQPKPMTCSACGTTGVQPRLRNNTSKTQVITEAQYVCPRCGNYFFRGITNIQQIAPQK